MTGSKGRGDIATCIYKVGKASTKQWYTHKPYRILNAIILKQLGCLTKSSTYVLAMYFLRMDLANWVSQPMIHVSQQTIQFCLKYIWQYFTTVVRSMHTSVSNLLIGEQNVCLLWNSDLIFLWGSILSLCSRQETEGSGVSCPRGEMSILAFVTAQLFEFNADMALVRVDGLSHTTICPCQGTQETGWICYHRLAATYPTTSAEATRFSKDALMWYPFPFHVTTSKKMFGQGPVLPMTSDQMKAMPVFSEQCHRKCGARKKQVQSRFVTWCTKISM